MEIIVLRDEFAACIEAQTPFHPNSELINLIEEDLSALDSIYEMGQTQVRIANDVLSMGKMQLNTLVRPYASLFAQCIGCA